MLSQRHTTWVIFVLVAGAGGCEQRAGLSKRLNDLGIELTGVENLEISGEHQVQPRVALLTARDDTRTLKLSATRHADRDAALRFVDEQRAMLRSIFDPKLPPYPEFLTRESGCPQAFQPEENRGSLGIYHLLFAGQRMGYGVCTADLVHYRAALGYFYCERGHTVFGVEAFVPHEGPAADFAWLRTLLDTASCR